MYYEILLEETKSSDVHETICETTKFATSAAPVCDYEEQLIWFDTNMGSFSFKPNETDPRTEIKCYQPVKPAFSYCCFNNFDNISLVVGSGKFIRSEKIENS